jgi:hypothetical protein
MDVHDEEPVAIKPKPETTKTTRDHVSVLKYLQFVRRITERIEEKIRDGYILGPKTWESRYRSVFSKTVAKWGSKCSLCHGDHD